MREIKNAKKVYESIVIPDELSERVNNAIEQASKKKKSANINSEIKDKEPNRRKGGTFMIKKYVKIIPAAVLGIAVIVFSVALNTSESFASHMQDIPVIGSLAEVLTIREYKKDGNITTSIKQPEILVKEESDSNEIADNEAVNTETNYVADVNTIIEGIVQDYKDNAYIEIEEYRQAFLETGGTQEEWDEREIDVDVSYEIKSQTDTTLSLELLAYQSWVNYSEVRYYFNMDLANGKDITLKELLGDNYIEVANESIRNQIIERMQGDEGYIYWGFEEYSEEYADQEDAGFEGFTTITDETKFYINEAGNPVIVYDKYDIAPGYMGAQEFEIIKN